MLFEKFAVRGEKNVDASVLWRRVLSEYPVLAEPSGDSGGEDNDKHEREKGQYQRRGGDQHRACLHERDDSGGEAQELRYEEEAACILDGAVGGVSDGGGAGTVDVEREDVFCAEDIRSFHFTYTFRTNLQFCGGFERRLVRLSKFTTPRRESLKTV